MRTEAYGERVVLGVIDPARVVRTALLDAASVASILITPLAALAVAPKTSSGGGRGRMGDMDF